jgi:hypothetical protein
MTNKICSRFEQDTSRIRLTDPFPLGNMAFCMKLRSLSNVLLNALRNANVNVGTAQADAPS